MQASIYKITPFDSSVGTTIKFSWSGNQAFKNRCIIRDNETNQVVYDNTIDSFKLEHPIDLTQAKLVNGTKYLAYLTVFDSDGNESDIQSLGTAFLCLTTPTFQFSGLSDNQTISSSNYTFSLEYAQENSELLDSWSINIYDYSHALISTSGTKYDTSDLTHSFSGFNNKTEYYVRALGQTVNGMELDTGYVCISIYYNILSVFSALEVTNLKKSGQIHIKSNIISPYGYVLNEPEKYIDNDYIDLQGNSLTYKEGFLLDKDYSFAAIFYGVQPNLEILKLSADDPDELTCVVTYRIGKFGSDTEQGCFELKVISRGISSVYYSEKISPPSGTDRIGLLIYRQNGYYGVEITNFGGDA